MNSSEVVTPQPPSDIEQQQQKKGDPEKWNVLFIYFFFASISANAAITFRFFSTLSTRP